MNTKTIVLATALSMLLNACGGGTESGPGQAPSGQAEPASSAGSGAGPDTSGLADIVLGKINANPTRLDMKATGKLLEFTIVSVKSDDVGGVKNAVVECAGVVQFDADADWGMSGVKKAGEPAKFECQVEYVDQGSGWQIFGPMGIYPL